MTFADLDVLLLGGAVCAGLGIVLRRFWSGVERRRAVVPEGDPGLAPLTPARRRPARSVRHRVGTAATSGMAVMSGAPSASSTTAATESQTGEAAAG